MDNNKNDHGWFDDQSELPGDFSKYGDPIMDTLLSLSLEQVENFNR